MKKKYIILLAAILVCLCLGFLLWHHFADSGTAMANATTEPTETPAVTSEETAAPPADVDTTDEMTSGSEDMMEPLPQDLDDVSEEEVVAPLTVEDEYVVILNENEGTGGG